MTDKKLRKLSKTELLWIIRDQEAEIQELKNKLKALQPEEVKDRNEAEDI